MIISQRAFDLIVAEETGGEAYYNKTEQHPDWPGGAFGVTIGVGYDCGYETARQITADWGGKLSPAMVATLCQVAGIHGSPAHSHAHEIRDFIDVPWAVALDVFRTRDVPKWEKIVQGALPNTDKLSGSSFGALVSLAFNCGASFDDAGMRYSEMRTIKLLMRDGHFDKIPAQIRSMARLWLAVKDLRDRREHEAALFESGLRESAPGPVSAAPALKPAPTDITLAARASTAGATADLNPADKGQADMAATSTTAAAPASADIITKLEAAVTEAQAFAPEIQTALTMAETVAPEVGAAAGAIPGVGPIVGPAIALLGKAGAGYAPAMALLAKAGAALAAIEASGVTNAFTALFKHLTPGQPNTAALDPTAAKK